MRSFVAIVKRETGSFTYSAVAPLVFAGFLLLSGFSFFDNMLHYSIVSKEALGSAPGATDAINVSDGIVQPLVHALSVLLLFLLPAVSMRLFSEEYRSGRYDLIMSWPVADNIWVLGKFVSVVVVGLLMLLATLPYFISIGFMTQIELGPIITSFIGLLLITMLVSAWGLFFSSLVQYQAVSYVLSFAFIILLYLSAGLESVLPGPIGKLGQYFSIPFHFRRFSFGTLDSRDLIYFLSLAIVGIYAATSSLASKRLSKRRSFAGWLPSILMILILVFVNVISSKYSFSVDLTSNKRFSPAPQTIQVLKSLDNKIQIDAFYNRTDPLRKGIEVMLQEMNRNTSMVSWNMYDPQQDIVEIEKFGIDRDRSVVVSSNSRSMTIDTPDESMLINAIFRVAEGELPVVYYLTGHGEPDLSDDSRNGMSGFKKAMTSQGYNLKPLLMAANPSVPADGSILFIVHPRVDFSSNEIVAIESFLSRGGALLFLLDPGTPISLQNYLASLNIKLENDFLVTANAVNNQLGVDGRVQVVYEYPAHPANKDMNGLAAFFPFAQSMSPVSKKNRKGLKLQTILMSDSQSWAETDYESLTAGQVSFDENDTRGPLAFGVAAEIDCNLFFNPSGSGTPVKESEIDSTLAGTMYETLHNKEKYESNISKDSLFSGSSSSRVIVIGDSDFVSNSNLNLYGNKDYLFNISNWLAKEKVLIALRGKNPLRQPLVLSKDQEKLIGWGSIAIWPAVITSILSGVVIFRRRS